MLHVKDAALPETATVASTDPPSLKVTVPLRANEATPESVAVKVADYPSARADPVAPLLSSGISPQVE